MGIATTLISGNEEETAVLAESYCGNLSLVFRFDLDLSQPLSISSRIATCFHQIEVDDEKKTFPDRGSMRQAIYDSIAHVWPICASNPTIRLPDVIIQIQQDDHGETTCRISHENAFREYLASLLPVDSIEQALIPEFDKIGPHYTSIESLQFSEKLGGRGGTTATRHRDRTDGGLYAYKGLSFRLFLEDKEDYKFERDTFYRELKVIYSLPSHPNILRPPSSLVTTGSPQTAIQGIGEDDCFICGALYPFLERQSLQEVIGRSNESRTRLPLGAKVKWAYQISSAMATVHSSGHYHMDLKPSNMLLNDEDDVIVIDWERCGASSFFLAPEANGLWDVELATNTKTGEEWKTEPGKARMAYRKFVGPLLDESGAWPRRNVFELWQRECSKALEAAEVYSAGRSLWVIFEQCDDVWFNDREQSEAKVAVWTDRSESVPEVWKDFVSRCMSLDPNQRPTFEEGERFWRAEWRGLEKHSK